MTKTDERMEGIQEQMYQSHHERLNAILNARLRTRTWEDTMQSLLTADALSVRTAKKAVLQRV